MLIRRPAVGPLTYARMPTGLRAPGYVRCGASADKDDHDVHPQGTTFQSFCRCSANICSAHKYEVEARRLRGGVSSAAK